MSPLAGKRALPQDDAAQTSLLSDAPPETAEQLPPSPDTNKTNINAVDLVDVDQDTDAVASVRPKQ